MAGSAAATSPGRLMTKVLGIGWMPVGNRALMCSIVPGPMRSRHRAAQVWQASGSLERSLVVGGCNGMRIGQVPRPRAQSG